MEQFDAMCRISKTIQKTGISSSEKVGTIFVPREKLCENADYNSTFVNQTFEEIIEKYFWRSDCEKKYCPMIVIFDLNKF